jgi:hypothetical protein
MMSELLALSEVDFAIPLFNQPRCIPFLRPHRISSKCKPYKEKGLFRVGNVTSVTWAGPRKPRLHLENC